MSKPHKWDGVPGQFAVELEGDESKLPPVVVTILKTLGWGSRLGDLYVVMVDFTSSGYYDPGQKFGPPERCYSPEGDEEREIQEVTVTFVQEDAEMGQDDVVKIRNNCLCWSQVQRDCESFWEKELEEAEIEHDDFEEE